MITMNAASEVTYELYDPYTVTFECALTSSIINGPTLRMKIKAKRDEGTNSSTQIEYNLIPPL